MAAREGRKEGGKGREGKGKEGGKGREGKEELHLLKSRDPHWQAYHRSISHARHPHFVFTITSASTRS